MATKTISLELDAYEKLRAQKRGRESFSEVVRRAVWLDAPKTGPEILEALRAQRWKVGEEVLEAIEAADRDDLPPEDPWSDEEVR